MRHVYVRHNIIYILFILNRSWFIHWSLLKTFTIFAFSFHIWILLVAFAKIGQSSSIEPPYYWKWRNIVWMVQWRLFCYNYPEVMNSPILMWILWQLLGHVDFFLITKQFLIISRTHPCYLLHMDSCMIILLSFSTSLINISRKQNTDFHHKGYRTPFYRK